MKKPYQSPRMAVELFDQTQGASGCTGIKISSVDTGCVLADPDSTVGMLDYAVMGGFLATPGCVLPVPDPGEGEEEICYHTSIFMAFTS